MEKLGINLGFFLFQLLNFGIIFFLLARFVWPRVTKMLDERTERIANGLEYTREAEVKLQKADADRNALLQEARAEAQRVTDEARRRTDEQINNMLRAAASEADERREQSRIQAVEERNRILAESRDQIVSLAIAAAEKLVGESLDRRTQQARLQKFFAAVPDGARNMGQQIEVTSAVPLTDAEKAEVVRVTGAKDVQYNVDPGILGGLILRSGDQVVDGSVRGDFTALTARLR